MEPRGETRAAAASSDVVPERWAADAGPERPPARPLPWRLVAPAIVGVLLAPTQLGPRIARSSIWKALAALAIGTVAACGAALPADRFGEALGKRWAIAAEQHFSVSERLRLPFVLVIDALYEVTGSLDWQPVLLVVGTVLAAAVLAPTLLAPLIAGRNERCGPCLWRALKLALWGTVAIAPGVLLVAGAWSDALVDWYALNTDMPDRDVRTVIAVEVAGLLWLSVLAWLGICVPVGLSDGPAPPRCGGCGYILTGLPFDGRCPECARPVGASAPGTRRPPAWATARHPLRRLTLYLETVVEALNDRAFFERLTVYRGREAALRFAHWTTWLGGLAVGAAIVLFGALVLPRQDWVALLASAIVAALGLVIALRLSLLLMMHIATRFGWRLRQRPAAVPVLYASAAFAPATIVIAVGFALFLLTVDTYDPDVPIGVFAIPVAVVVGIWLTIRALRRALRATRYANE